MTRKVLFPAKPYGRGERCHHHTAMHTCKAYILIHVPHMSASRSSRTKSRRASGGGDRKEGASGGASAANTMRLDGKDETVNLVSTMPLRYIETSIHSSYYPRGQLGAYRVPSRLADRIYSLSLHNRRRLGVGRPRGGRRRARPS